MMTEFKKETFRFGNDGVKASYSRYRLPMVIGSACVLVWTSVVRAECLGLLLGPDFLEAIGGVISFTRRALRADCVPFGLEPWPGDHGDAKARAGFWRCS